MTAPRQHLLIPAMLFTMVASASGQVYPWPAGSIPVQYLVAPSASVTQDPENSANSVQPLLDFNNSDIKFSLSTMMETLRDHRHEGWVLAAYPDPKTNRPLIGAGFSLDLLGTEHPQRDPRNPRSFVEPSSAQLWQAAGLAPDRLQQILDQYDRNVTAWSSKTYRKKIIRHTLTPQLTEEEATRLLRISAIQAIVNARAYCRDFDRLTGPQQMAVSQLVFQMGTNLEQFVEFLGTINDLDSARELPQLNGFMETEPERWSAVQNTLIDSQWARLFSDRAVAVIAMFDPEYLRDPVAAEQKVQAVLHPPAEHPSRHHSPANLRTVSYSRHSAAHSKKSAHASAKAKLT